MKVNVTSVNPNPWKPDDAPADFKPIYTFNIEGQGEPQKTTNPALATVGEHEAYQKPSKSGKLYWYTDEEAKLTFPTKSKSFQADPIKLKQEYSLEVAKNLSIQRQVAVKGVVDLIVAGKREYGDLQITFDDLMVLLNPKLAEEDVVIERAEDFVKINPVDYEEIPVDQLIEPF